jgi:hypothetical protein
MVPKQIPIFERARLMFSSIAHKVPFFDAVIENFVPLQAGRKSSASTSTEMRFFQLGNDGLRVILGDALNPGLITPLLAIRFNLPWFAPYLPQHARC